MQTPSNPSDEVLPASQMEDIMISQAVRTSLIPDARNILKSEYKEEAFLRRYGKKVKLVCSYELNPDGRTFKEVTCVFETEKRQHYSLTEYLANDVTDYVLLCYRRNGRNIENKFNRYIDAEITLADLISEE
jgi:hypothetical protein